MSLPSINFLHLTVSVIQPGQDFIAQGHYGKVKSRSHHDVAHLHALTNVPTKYQLPTPYGFRDVARTRFSISRSLRSNQGHTMTLHTNTPNQCPYQVSTSYTLQFPRYRPDKLLPAARSPAHPDTMGENITPTALMGCGVKSTMATVVARCCRKANQLKSVQLCRDMESKEPIKIFICPRNKKKVLPWHH